MRSFKPLLTITRPSLTLQFSTLVVVVSYIATVVILLSIAAFHARPTNVHTQIFLPWYEKAIIANVANGITSAQPLVLNIETETQLNHWLSTPQFINTENSVKNQWFALVDPSGEIIKSWGTHQFETSHAFLALPLSSRDDLADALIDKYNSGIELQPDGSYLIVRALKTANGDIAGALIAKQQWHFNKGQYTFLSNLKLISLTDVLFIALLPLGLVCVVIVLVILIANKRFKKEWHHLETVLTEWESGQFSKQLNEANAAEIATSYRKLNKLANALEKHIATEQLQTDKKARQYLAAELHDTVKQTLFANNLALASAKNYVMSKQFSQTAQFLDKAIEGNQNAFTQISELIDTLPVESSEYEPSENLQNALRNTLSKSGLAHQLSGPLPNYLKTDNRILFLKVLKEVLKNIEKHSTADTIKIKLGFSKKENHVLMTLVDNGHVASIYPQQGLSLMQKRVEQCGGELFINTGNHAPFLGVEISLWLPN